MRKMHLLSMTRPTGALLSWWTRGHRKVQARHEEKTSYYEVATMLIDGRTTARSRMTRAYEVSARFLTSFSEFLVAYPRRPDYLALTSR